jgi:hypothetical protein
MIGPRWRQTSFQELCGGSGARYGLSGLRAVPSEAAVGVRRSRAELRSRGAAYVMSFGGSIQPMVTPRSSTVTEK